ARQDQVTGLAHLVEKRDVPAEPRVLEQGPRGRRGRSRAVSSTTNVSPTSPVCSSASIRISLRIGGTVLTGGSSVRCSPDRAGRVPHQVSQLHSIHDWVTLHPLMGGCFDTQ